MADAYQAFYAAVQEGRVRHAGGRTLTAYVMATGAEKTDGGWKIRKIRQTQRIDATVASVIAHYRAEQQAVGYLYTSVYEERGLLILGGHRATSPPPP